MQARTVGLLGTGRMGSAMARALASAGYDLVLWNRTPEAAEHLASTLGRARIAARPADVAASVDVALTMLADEAAVEAVFGGPDGLIAGAPSGSVLVDCSTVPPAVLQGLAPNADARGVGLLDAPVSGSIALAETGKLTLMVGGAAEHLATARPVLDALAATVFHLGPLGSGAAMKLAVNTVIFGLNQALAEGLVLAEAAGVERALAYEVLTASAAGAPYVGYKRGSFLDPETAPVGFALELAAKDLRLIGELAAAVGLDLPQVVVNDAVIRAAAARLGGERDFATVAVHLRAHVEEGEGASV